MSIILPCLLGCVASLPVLAIAPVNIVNVGPESIGHPSVLRYGGPLSNIEVDVEAAWESSFAHSEALEITALFEGSSAIASEASEALSPFYDSEISSGSEGTSFSSLPNTPDAAPESSSVWQHGHFENDTPKS